MVIHLIKSHFSSILDQYLKIEINHSKQLEQEGRNNNKY